jgi:protein-export membrane protein SecD
MAVDANVLIFERMREELRGGAGVRRAISQGYEMALSSIVDANVTTIIAGVVLYQFGSGPVRGFAVTLIMGILTSMFTALVITRLIFEWQYNRGGDEPTSMSV